ncbi:MAG TPA: SUF system NifU family Fe-S cluster assembly protein [Polyangia bacterium]|jgi:nitrogen fixation NifU-like protein
MSPLDELYQEVILDHHRSPRNHRALPDASGKAVGHNPLCGDQVTVYVTLEGDRVANVAFEGAGCAISQAAASLMTVAVKGKPVAEVERLRETFHEMITGHEIPAEAETALGKLCAFSGVAAFPLRVKCASLPWHTLKAALHGQAAAVSTE